MNNIKHGDISVKKITNKVWVAKTITFEIMRAEIEIKGDSMYNAYYKLINFIESNQKPKKIELLPNGNKIYKF